MKTRKIAYYLYFVAVASALIGIIADNDLLLLIAKPTIIPSIYYYYLTKTKKANFWFTMVLLLNFIGDSVILLKIKDPMLIMVPYYLSYLVLIRFIVFDMAKIKYNWNSLLFSALVLAGHALMLYMVLDLQSMDGKKLITPYTIYGITMSVMVTLSVYNYLADRSIACFYMMIACGCCLVSDVFYVLYNQHFHIPILNYINSFMQLITYFFLVKYIINRKNGLNPKPSTKPNGTVN
ncbi:MAG TPA: lysoplasmalogenase family protein [Flavobacterium sp.]|nr:lysoplasmalogenase family protein [Flavobacterium sp.]